MTALAPSVAIAPLAATPETLDALAAILVDVVAGGGSVGFMHPLTAAAARSFWERSLAAAAHGERVVLGARVDGALAATLTLLLDFPPNQPHRAELAKMMTAPAHRGRGLASALIAKAEALARRHGRDHLMLDTASDGGAAALYERHGFLLAGEVPAFALKPHGGLTGTRYYYKRFG